MHAHAHAPTAPARARPRPSAPPLTRARARSTKAALDAPYCSMHAYGATYGAHRDALELPEAAWRELKAHADAVGIPLTASGWDEASVDFLDALGVPFFKVASADLLNFPLLAHTASKGKPLVISTGMAAMDDVRRAVAFLRGHTDRIVLCHCTSTYVSGAGARGREERGLCRGRGCRQPARRLAGRAHGRPALLAPPAQYLPPLTRPPAAPRPAQPCPPQHVNLRAIQTFIHEFPDIVIGYSGARAGAGGGGRPARVLPTHCAAVLREQSSSLSNLLQPCLLSAGPGGGPQPSVAAACHWCRASDNAAARPAPGSPLTHHVHPPILPLPRAAPAGHENGVAIGEAAAVLGAQLVERHFTLDRTMKGGDHAASLEPR